MLATRPDLCFAVGYLSRFQEYATDEHWSHVKRILRYLKETKDLKLIYRCCDAEPLVGYLSRLC